MKMHPWNKNTQFLRNAFCSFLLGKIKICGKNKKTLKTTYLPVTISSFRRITSTAEYGGLVVEKRSGVTTDKAELVGILRGMQTNLVCRFLKKICKARCQRLFPLATAKWSTACKMQRYTTRLCPHEQTDR